jgi:predicted phage terminase large subunit-like protein
LNLDVAKILDKICVEGERQLGTFPTELSDYSVCTTWGLKEKHLYLLQVIRKRFGYPELKRAVREQAELFDPQTILIEDRASGTQLIQELVGEGMYAIKSYEPAMDKIMRLHSVTSTIENGFVHLPDKACWLSEYIHELIIFPKGKNDDQADSTSQALDWFKQRYVSPKEPWSMVSSMSLGQDYQGTSPVQTHLVQVHWLVTLA